MRIPTECLRVQKVFFFLTGLIFQKKVEKFKNKQVFSNTKPNKSSNTNRPTLGYIGHLTIATDTKTNNSFISFR